MSGGDALLEHREPRAIGLGSRDVQREGPLTIGDLTVEVGRDLDKY